MPGLYHRQVAQTRNAPPTQPGFNEAVAKILLRALSKEPDLLEELLSREEVRVRRGGPPIELALIRCTRK